MKAKLNLLLTITLTIVATLPIHAQYARFTIFAGCTNAIGTNDGVGASALFNHPRGLAVDPAGNVYVSDTGNSSIRLITPDGTVTTPALQTVSPVHSDVVTIPPSPPVYVAFTIQSPQALTMDAKTNLYVGDNMNNVVYKVQPGSNWSVTIAAGAPNFGGTAFTYLPGLVFNQPCGLAVDTNGNLFVADAYNQVIKEVDTSGNVTTLAGQLGVPGTSDGTGTNAMFSFPYGLAIGQSNTLYETDLNYGIRQINSNVVNEFCYKPLFGSPHAIATDAAGNVYITGLDGSFSPVVIQITPQGASNILGTLPTTGTISAIAVDANTNIYLADQQNSVIIKSVPYPPFFNNQTALGNGDFYLAFAQGTNSVPFGYYNLGNFPFPIFYHYDLGFEMFTDANDAENGAYLYDYTSSTYWYTSPRLFPYMYDFSLNSWLYYYPNTNQPGRYTSNPRYFFDYAQGTIITK